MSSWQVLPSNLKLQFLVEWTTLNDLVHVDLALCNEQRVGLHAQFNKQQNLLVFHGFEETKDHGSRCIAWKQLHWLYNRKLQVRSILVGIENYYDDQPDISPENAVALLYQKRVTKISIQMFSARSPKCLQPFLQQNSQLQEIDIKFACTDGTIELIAENCPQITTINTSGYCYAINGEMKALFTSCRSLTDVCINFNSRIDDEVIAQLAKLTLLRRVSFRGIKKPIAGITVEMMYDMLLTLLARFQTLQVSGESR